MIKHVLATLLLAAAGCTSYRSASGPLPSIVPVRVSYAAPRDVMVTTPEGNSLFLTGVSAIEGVLLSGTADSMQVLVSVVHSTSGKMEGIPRRSVAAIARGSAVRIEEGYADGAKSAGAVLLVGALLAVVAAVAFITSLQNAYGS